MGKHYEEPFRRLVQDLDASTLVAFADESLDPHYRRHIVATLADLGVPTVPAADAANFVVGGYVTRDHDEAVGLLIDVEQVGRVELYPDGHRVLASGAAA